MGTIFAATLLLAAFCIGQSERKRCDVPPPSIVGGHEAIMGSRPWQVIVRIKVTDGVEYEDRIIHWCGGSLIAPQWILSAAYCFTNSATLYRGISVGRRVDVLNVEFFEVILGAHYAISLHKNCRSITKQVQKIIVHEDYWREGQSSNDIALFKIDTPVKYDVNIQPIKLPMNDVLLEPEQIVIVTGWGFNRAKPRSPHDELQEVSVHVTSQEYCSRYMIDLHNRSDRHLMPRESEYKWRKMVFCAAAQPCGKHSCVGEYGAPLVAKTNGEWMQYGIGSDGGGCGDEDNPGVYTKISNYIDWINSKIH